MSLFDVLARSLQGSQISYYNGFVYNVKQLLRVYVNRDNMIMCDIEILVHEENGYVRAATRSLEFNGIGIISNGCNE